MQRGAVADDSGGGSILLELLGGVFDQRRERCGLGHLKAAKWAGASVSAMYMPAGGRERQVAALAQGARAVLECCPERADGQGEGPPC